jgi:O-antigen ligase
VLLAALAWGVLAFGAVYPWAYWPLAGAAMVVAALALVARRGRSRTDAPLRWLAAPLAGFAIAASLQLVPVRLTMMRAMTPETVRVLEQLNPAVASGSVAVHPVSIAPQATLVGIALFAACAALALASAVIFSQRGARGFARALTILGVLVAMAGIVQQPLFNGKIYGLWTPIDGGAPYGPFVNKNHFAGWMLMALPVTIGLLLGGIARAMRGVRPTWRDRVVWFSSPEASRLILFAAAALAMALALVLTLSRSGVTSLAAALAITGAFAARRQWSGGRSRVAVAYLAFLVVVVVVWVGGDVIASRFSEADWGEFNARRGAWADAADIRARFPLAGTGLNSYGVATVLYQRHDLAHRYTEAHNDYLQLAAEGGWLLTIPAAICVLAFAAAVRRRFAEETSATAYWLRVGAVTGIAAVALQELVDFSLQMPGNAALFAVLCGIALHKAPSRPTP